MTTFVIGGNAKFQLGVVEIKKCNRFPDMVQILSFLSTSPKFRTPDLECCRSSWARVVSVADCTHWLLEASA